MGALAEIFRRHGPVYRAQFAGHMPLDQLRVMWAIERCRTAALGGHVWRCPHCGRERFSFHSCGNRHCPACGQDDAREWLRRQEALRLPVTYHLCGFTVPEELRRVIRSHPREGLAILFSASSSTLLDLCANPKWFGALPGVTGVLHTWTRAQVYHPHVHYLVTGGGLAPDGSWREADHQFLVPVTALSRIFRARFRDACHKRLPEVFAVIPKEVWQRDWVVHSKSVGNGEQALRYLSRYLFRVALADSAILAHDEHRVTFRYRDSETGKSRTMTLPVMEFIRRFLQHVLPSGFVKVRYYGLHHPTRCAALTLARAALYLRQGRPFPPPVPEPEPCRMACPDCATSMVCVQVLAPLRRIPGNARAPPVLEGASE